MFQQDSATIYRFVFQGELTCVGVQELEHTWTTARSILRTRAQVVEFSGITNAHVAGVELLSRMRETGARLNAALPPEFRRVYSFQWGSRWQRPFGRPARCRSTQSVSPHHARSGTAALVSTVRQNACPFRDRDSKSKLQASRKGSWCGRKEVPNGFRCFGNWGPFAFELFHLACQSKARG